MENKNKPTEEEFRKRLIYTMITTVVGLIVLVAATIAWFAQNDSVETSGMQESAKSPASMVIWDPEEGRSSYSAIIDFASSSEIEYLQPATHAWFYDPDSGEVSVTTASQSQTGLIYNDNPSNVSADTGYKAEKKDDLTFAAVEEGKNYYRDYIIEMSSLTKPMTITEMNVTISYAGDEDVLENTDYLKAATVDFYLGTVSQATYKGKLNLAGSLKTPADSINLISGTSSYEIPEIDLDSSSLSSDDAVQIIMRCYLDGALENETDGTAYVHARGLKTRDLQFKVTFSVNEKQ